MGTGPASSGLNVRMWGEGPAVVWLHAFPFSSAMWEGDHQTWSSRFTVVAPDLPGFGKSPAPPGGFTMAGAAHAVHDTLVDLDIKRPFILGGLSMGGYITFEYMRAYPDHVGGIILASTKAQADSEEAKAGRMKSIASIKKIGIEVFNRMFLQKCLCETTQDKRLEVVKRVEGMLAEATQEAAIDGLQGLADRRDSLDALHGIRCPALVIAGHEDQLISVEDHQLMQRTLPHATLVVIPEAGHLVNLEQPALFHQAVGEFLEPFA